MRWWSLALVAQLGQVHSEEWQVRQVHPDEWDDVVLNARKSSFVMFYAPWCEHCTRFKPVFEQVEDSIDDDDVQLLAVDCDGYGAPLCKRLKVSGYPALLYFNPPDDEPHKYVGDRDLESLVEFVGKHIKPGCMIERPAQCMPMDLRRLDSLLQRHPDENAAELALLRQIVDEAEETHEALKARMSSQLKESEDKAMTVRRYAVERLNMFLRYDEMYSARNRYRSRKAVPR